MPGYITSLKKVKTILILFKEKLQAIKSVDVGKTIESVARIYGVEKVAIGDWSRGR